MHNNVTLSAAKLWKKLFGASQLSQFTQGQRRCTLWLDSYPNGLTSPLVQYIPHIAFITKIDAVILSFFFFFFLIDQDVILCIAHFGTPLVFFGTARLIAWIMLITSFWNPTQIWWCHWFFFIKRVESSRKWSGNNDHDFLYCVDYFCCLFSPSLILVESTCMSGLWLRFLQNSSLWFWGRSC